MIDKTQSWHIWTTQHDKNEYSDYMYWRYTTTLPGSMSPLYLLRKQAIDLQFLYYSFWKKGFPSALPWPQIFILSNCGDLDCSVVWKPTETHHMGTKHRKTTIKSVPMPPHYTMKPHIFSSPDHILVIFNWTKWNFFFFIGNISNKTQVGSSYTILRHTDSATNYFLDSSDFQKLSKNQKSPVLAFERFFQLNNEFSFLLLKFLSQTVAFKWSSDCCRKGGIHS